MTQGRRILAIDTASECGSIALIEGEAIILEQRWCLPLQGHTEVLVPSIDGALKLLGWKASELAGIAVTNGPGSFTGLRIALSAAKGIAAAHSLPVTGVSTLAALAHTVPASFDHIVVMLDARKQEIYGAAYSGTKDGFRKPTVPDQVSAPATFLQAHGRGATVFAGPGAHVYRDQIRSCFPSAVILNEGDLMPRATATAHLAARAPAGTWVASSALALSYLRAPEAEVHAANASTK